MKKNVAILYDIENLVGGYSLQYLSEISLKNILLKLKEMGLNNIAIQKAYADWSNIKLSKLKWDISDLGIEPIQMFGFSKGMTKNASDIQLVIDAMEILYTKDFIDTFVIVSGDGGFSTLVKKISEYGKRVIGCAYSSTANQIFTKVCDDFIFIDSLLTQEQLQKIQQAEIEENKKKAILENPILKQIIPEMQRLSNYDLDDVEEYFKKFVEKLESNIISSPILKKEGLNISILKNAIDYLFNDFDYRQFGFIKLTDFIRYILKGTNLKLVLREPSEYRVVFNNVELPDFKTIEYLYDRPEIHSKDNYLQVLSYKNPIIKLPENINTFYKVINYIFFNQEIFKHISYQDFITELSKLDISEKELNNIFYFLVNTKNLLGDNSSPILKEQNFYFSPLNKEELIGNIKQAMIDKIITTYGYVDEEEINNILNEFFQSTFT